MIYLVDTNVLLRYAEQNLMVRKALIRLIDNGHEPRTSSQNLTEFWTVSTRPTGSKNGLGFTPSEADRWLKLIDDLLFPLLPDPPDLYPEWRRLVVTYEVSGRPTHDARLVALMKLNSITHILTIDRDFTRYADEGIVAVDPAMI